MTPKAKAASLFNKMYKYQLDKSSDVSWQLAKKQALVCVDQMEEALTNYGAASDELQNMDSEWRYLDEVKTEIAAL
jgi:hypothetical protein